MKVAGMMLSLKNKALSLERSTDKGGQQCLSCSRCFLCPTLSQFHSQRWAIWIFAGLNSGL